MSTPSIPSTALRKIAHIIAKPGQAERLRAALSALERETRREPGCQAFTFYQALGEEARFLLLEQFASQAALDAHMQLPHTRAFFEAGLVEGVTTEGLAVR